MNGESFGNYRFLRKLAVGGMGEIFVAKRLGPEGFEKLVVIKRLLPQFSSDPRFVATFLNEARLAARLRHPNITQIHDLGKMGDTFFLCMEFVDGLNLREFILAHDRPPGRPIPIPAAVRICAKIFSALDYAHDRAEDDGRPLHIVHQDISPPNILLSREGEVKLTDFGIAKATLWGEETTLGILRGKFPYMSPEHVAGVSQDKLSDLYAVGIILYELLTGTPPFRETGSPLRLLSSIRFEPVPDPRRLRQEIPGDLLGLLLRLLEKEPERRPQNAREVLSVLEGLPEYKLCTDRELARLVLERTPAAAQPVDRDEATLPAALPLRDRGAPATAAAPPAGTPRAAPHGTGRLPWVLALLVLLAGGAAAWFLRPSFGPGPASTGADLRSRGRTGAAAPHGPAERFPAAAADAPRDTPTEAPQRPEPAAVTLTFSPDDAQVRWNGFPQAGSSPVTRSGLEPDRPHLLRIERPGYEPQERTLVLSPGEHRSVRLRLDPLPVRLDLSSQPQGARIWVDGKPVDAPTPALGLLCAPDTEHRLRVEKDGYQPWTVRLRAGRGEHRSIVADLVPLQGSIRIDSTPWTEVILDGTRLGRTPYLSDAIPAGTHTLRLVNPERMIAHEEPLRVAHGQTVKKRYRFTGTLDFSGVAAGTEIFLNSERIGTAPLPPRPLPVGNCEVTLSNREARTERRIWVRILTNATSRVLPEALPGAPGQTAAGDAAMDPPPAEGRF